MISILIALKMYITLVPILLIILIVYYSRY